MIQKDKIKHIIAGLIVFFVVWIGLDVHIAMIATVLAGAAKEIIWDYIFKKGYVELLDFVATIAMPFIIYVIYLIV